MSERSLESPAAIQARVDTLLEAGKNVYQPLYNYPYAQKIPPLRACADRCSAIENSMAGAMTGRRLLDVGCSLGYNTLYFVDRGMIGHGIDILERNVALCQEMQRFTPGDHRFWCSEFDRSFVDELRPGEYDYAFLFSVLHHIVELKGLAYVQRLMRELLARVPVLYVELALRSETPPPGYTWDAHLPEDALDLFVLIPKSKITLIGQFPTHVGPMARPLYRVDAPVDDAA